MLEGGDFFENRMQAVACGGADLAFHKTCQELCAEKFMSNPKVPGYRESCEGKDAIILTGGRRIAD